MKKLLFTPLLTALIAAPAWAGSATRMTESSPAPDAFREPTIAIIGLQ